jgi:flagellar basal body-associated protein FliL
MSNSYRIIGAAFGLIAILLLVGLMAFAVWSFKSIEEYQKANSDNRQEISSYKQETGEQYAKACLEEDKPISAWAYCIVNSIDASRDAQRSNYDLKAQQEMAVWAYSLLLLTIGGFVISVVGLAALFLSLAQTRTAIKDTREIGEAQVRAYVRITEGTVKLVSAHPSATDQLISPEIAIKIKNYGQSPALRFQFSVIARYYPPMHAPFLGSLGVAPESWGRDVGCNEDVVMRHGLGSAPLDEVAMQSTESPELHMDFVIRYAFRDVFDRRVQAERVFMALLPKNRINIEVPLIPHVFDKETIERNIDANRLFDTRRISDPLPKKD